MKFRYQARDKQGKLQSGSIEAADSRAAAKAIMSRGLIPLQVEAGGRSSATKKSVASCRR